MSTLKTHLPGGFELRGGDEPLPPLAARTHSLPAHLVVHSGCASPSEYLAGLFRTQGKSTSNAFTVRLWQKSEADWALHQ